MQSLIAINGNSNCPFGPHLLRSPSPIDWVIKLPKCFGLWSFSFNFFKMCLVMLTGLTIFKTFSMLTFSFSIQLASWAWSWINAIHLLLYDTSLFLTSYPTFTSKFHIVYRLSLPIPTTAFLHHAKFMLRLERLLSLLKASLILVKPLNIMLFLQLNNQNHLDNIIISEA